MTISHVTEQSITAALQRAPPDRWPEVLAFIVSLEPAAAASAPIVPGRRWSASELRRLPPAERDAILAEQAAALADEYRSNPELTAFEAFGEEDLDVDGSDGRSAVRSGSSTSTAQGKPKSMPLLKLGDRVRLRYSGGLLGRIVELRGPLGPGGAQIYRVRVEGMVKRPTPRCVRTSYSPFRRSTNGGKRDARRREEDGEPSKNGCGDR